MDRSWCFVFKFYKLVLTLFRYFSNGNIGSKLSTLTALLLYPAKKQTQTNEFRTKVCQMKEIHTLFEDCRAPKLKIRIGRYDVTFYFSSKLENIEREQFILLSTHSFFCHSP